MKRATDGPAVSAFVGSRWFEERSPFVEFLDRDMEVPRWEIEVAFGQTFVERLDRHIEEDRLHGGSEVPSTAAIVVSFGSHRDTVVQDDADSTGQQAFGKFPLHLIDESLPLVSGCGLCVVGVQLADPGVGIQHDSLASGFELLRSCRLARSG